MTVKTWIRRSGSRTGSGRRKTALIRVKMVVFAPMPSASETTMTDVSARWRSANRTAQRTSCSIRSLPRRTAIGKGCADGRAGRRLRNYGISMRRPRRKGTSPSVRGTSMSGSTTCSTPVCLAFAGDRDRCDHLAATVSFILVSHRGDLKVNAWNWRPTLEVLLAESVVTREQYERLGAHGCGGRVEAQTADRIADVIDRRLTGMKPGDRVLADLTVTSRKKVPVVLSPSHPVESIDVNDLYSASYDWLVEFRDFCRQSGGFEVY